MLKIWLIVIAFFLHTAFLHAEDKKYKFTVGSNLGNIPLEINKMSKNNTILPGIKINSWTVSPNFSYFAPSKDSFNFSENKISKDSIYMKFYLRF